MEPWIHIHGAMDPIMEPWILWVRYYHNLGFCDVDTWLHDILQCLGPSFCLKSAVFRKVRDKRSRD